ncbi:MAG TPA: DNA-binding response regulator [Verrucomicrobia bacterium]|nr:MAG: DNA-binding response regulator [Lentisphaerae bacterium GWF2_57_35]HBA84084.1 DNA-binding response regulator [Verrucomicrobiota bacterium]
MTAKTSSKAREKTAKRVLLVDDHPIVRHGLSMLIEQEPDLSVCGEADDACQALEAVKKLHPDIVLVDLSLRETSGLDLIKDLKIRHPAIPALVLSMHDESLYAERALRAGARGYLMKQQAVANIAVAIRRVLAGEVHISKAIINKMLNKVTDNAAEASLTRIDSLSDRELEVFQLLGQGYGTREIAERLHLSVKTIESYREHLKQKLEISSASELVRCAIEWGRSGG